MAKIFTKKFVLIMLTVVIAASGIIWAVVANIQSKFNSGITVTPAGNAVSGNGSASVLVDDYLYFVGDSIATSEIKYGDNEYYANGKMQDTGIFRVKLQDGKPVLDYEYNNQSKNDAGEKIELQPGDEGYNTVVVGVNDWDNIGDKGNGIEAVVPKIAGHDKTAMWVFGKTLVYVSPHNRYDNRGNLLSNYLDFFRVDLDGKNHELVYTTQSPDLTTENFTVWADSVDNVHILVHEVEKTSLVKINIKDKKVSTVADEVTNVALPQATHYSQNANETLGKVYGGVMGYVYYTQEREENDNNKGNVLYRCAIKNGEPEMVARDGIENEGATFTPLAVTPLQNGNAQFVFSVNYTNEDEVHLCVISNDNMNDYNYDRNTHANSWGINKDETVKVFANGYCAINNQLRYYEINGDQMILSNQNMLSATVDKVLAVYDKTIYIQSGTTVWKATLHKTATSISVEMAVADQSTENESSENEESTTEEETTENAITLPIAVLYQPHGETGDPMIFVQDTMQIRLYTGKDKINYLKFKE